RSAPSPARAVSRITSENSVDDVVRDEGGRPLPGGDVPRGARDRGVHLFQPAPAHAAKVAAGPRKFGARSSHGGGIVRVARGVVGAQPPRLLRDVVRAHRLFTE